MRRYIKFDAERFIKDSRSWTDEMKSLQDELDSITEIGGAGDGQPRGGGISNPTVKTAAQKEAVKDRMDRIKEYQDCFLYAWKCIGEDDQYILKGFYFAPGYIHQFVELWVSENLSNREYCYRARREALERFGKACERWMELNGYDV